MEKTILEKAKEQANILLNAGPSCPEIKKAAKDFLDAIGTEKEKEMTRKLLEEAAEDVEPIDGMIAFFESEMAAAMFGKEEALKNAEEGKKMKAAGSKYCFCDACTACLALLDMKEALLG